MAVAGAVADGGGLGDTCAGAMAVDGCIPDGSGTECRWFDSKGRGKASAGTGTGVGADGTARAAGSRGVSTAGADNGIRTVAWSTTGASRAGGRKAVGHKSRTWSSSEARMA